MSLVSARTEFARLSGRHDLVTDFGGGDYTDNGADWFIQRGLDELDLMLPLPKSEKQYKVDLTADSYLLTVQRIIALHEVWMANADGRWQLEEKDEQWMKDSYPTPYSDLTGARPKYYTQMRSELSPDLKDLRSDDYTSQFTFDYQDVLFHTDDTPHYKKIRVIVMPPSDETFTASVVGRFLSEEISEESDENFWTYNHEDLVVLAAMMMMEKTFRNMTGVREYREEIMNKLTLIDKGAAEQEQYNINQMEG